MSSGIRSNYSYDENDESLSASMDGVAALPTSQERHTVLDKLGDSAGSRQVDAKRKLFIISYKMIVVIEPKECIVYFVLAPIFNLAYPVLP